MHEDLIETFSPEENNATSALVQLDELTSDAFRCAGLTLAELHEVESHVAALRRLFTSRS